jgi:hypothetical protein
MIMALRVVRICPLLVVTALTNWSATWGGFAAVIRPKPTVAP